MNKPYRDNVAAVIINAEGKIFAGWKHGGWELPQGGVDEGETFREAVQREIAEELGTDCFRIVRESTEFHRYDWTAPVAPHKKKYRGQRQKYFLLRYEGTDKDIDVHAHGELAAFTWLTPPEVIEEAWPVKRPLYRDVLQEFGLV